MWKMTVSICYLFLTLTALGQQAKPVTITGRIVDSNAQPVAGAEVAVYKQLYDYVTREDYAKLLDEIKRTDADGRFAVNANIHVWHNVFAVARKERLALGWDVLVSGTNDETVANFNIILESPCTLEGTVVDEKGSPVVGAKVRALPKTSYLRRLRQRPILAPKQWFTTQTDNNGHFTFKDFSADARSDFWVEAPGRASVYKYTTNYLSACGYAAGKTDIRLVLPQETPVRGRVINGDTGKPVPAAHIVIRPDPDSVVANINPYCPRQAVSGQIGQFLFDGVPYSKHFIQVSFPQNETQELVGKTIKLDLRAGEPVKDVIVKLAKGGQIELVACETTTQKPICGVAVYFWQTREDDESGFYEWLLTRTDGTLLISAPPGECNYSAQCDGYSPSRVNDQVVVTKGQTSRVDILLDHNPVASKPQTSEVRPPLVYAGKVTDTDGKTIPAARVSLWVRKADGLWPFGPEVLADAQGRYKITAVPPEQTQFDCRISVNAAGYGSAQFKRISSKAKQVTTVEMETIALKKANLSISGIVVDAEGNPAPGLPIFLNGTDQPDQTSATDANGRFVFNRICEGPLRLQASFDNSPGGSGTLRAEGGDQNIKIILGRSGAHEPYVSLTSKVLPELKDLGIELSPADIRGKMILLCFWDMQQRPSRRCMTQLGKQAEQLKNKGVITIALQASNMDQQALNQWIKKYNILFPVGMVRGDEKKARLDWGVKSLPWLILTDRKHIVRVEGFGLDNLDNMIEEINNVAQ